MSRSKIPVALTVTGNTLLPTSLQIALYRITQEALNNIFKHAQATTVSIRLIRLFNAIELVIIDDGVGFTSDFVAPDRLGLAIMRERAEQAGLDLCIDSKPNQGTRIVALSRSL
jgi:signal transduction histidine kinase